MTSNSPEPTLNQPEQLSELLRLLESETRQMEAARDQLNIKRQILVEGKPKELVAIDRQLLALSKKANELAREREALTLQLGCPQETLKSMIPRMPAQFIPRFRLVRDQLQRAAMDVEQLNRENRELLNLSLKWVQDTVEVIANALNPEGASYTPQGGKKTKQGVPNDMAPTQSTVIHTA